MSRRDWDYLSHPVTIGVLALIVALIFMGVWEESARYTEDRLNADYAAGHYAKKAEKDIADRCIDTDPGQLKACIEEIVETSRDAQRGEQDLNAQKNMARWALLMMIFSGLSVGLTGIGIVLVRATLQANRDAVKAAQRAVSVTRQMGRAQVRAYLTCSDARFEMDDYAFFCMPILENKGLSPAKAIEIKADVQVHISRPSPGPLGFTMETLLSKPATGTCEVIGAGGNKTGTILWLHTEFDGDAFDQLRKQGAGLTVRCVVNWWDVFDKSQSIMLFLSSHQTTGSFSLRQPVRHGKLEVYTQRHGDQAL